MTRLFALNLQPLQQGGWRKRIQVLPPERQAKALGCRFDADRARVVGAGWLLRQSLLELGIPEEAHRFRVDAMGKPHLEGEQVQFNLSHSGLWAVCAVSDRPVGVDVELPRCSMDIARRHFHPQELEGVEQLPPMVQRDQLNRLWTAKEAFLKALGTGITRELDSFRVCLTEQGASLEQSLSPVPYRLHEYTLDAHRICLCTPDDRPELEVL